MQPTVKLISATLLGAFILAGCGGGDSGSGGNGTTQSGGGTSPGRTQTPALPVTKNTTLLASFVSNLDSLRASATRLLNQDARYKQQTADGRSSVNTNGTSGIVRLRGNPIEAAGIHYAHAAGLTGAGETIAFSDSGFLPSHEVFSGKRVTLGNGLSVADHGTFVASVALGNSSSMIGVAPRANAIFGSYNSPTQLAATARSATSAGAVALNNSWGFKYLTANRPHYDTVFNNSSWRDYLNALQGFSQNGIVVFSVANDFNATTVGLMPGLPIFHPELEHSWLAVVNGVPQVNGDDIVSAERVSGACLDAAAWCIAANGSWTGANAQNGYQFGTGTSFAAPTVSGALALLAEAFPNMTHQQLRIRLLATADNDFTGFTKSGSKELVPGFNHDYSREWGHGFLDVAAALLPIGQPTVTTGNGTTIDPGQPIVVSGAAAGNAIARSLEGVDVVSRDALSAGFVIDAQRMVAAPAAKPLFSLNDVMSFAQVQNDDTGGTAFFGDNRITPLSALETNLEIALFRSETSGDDSISMGLTRKFDLGDATLKLSAAYGDDTASLLSDWSGGTDTSIFSVDMALAAALSERSQLSFEFGYAFGKETSSLGQAADVLMNASALSFQRRDLWKRNDSLNISISLPAAITSGSTSVSLPVRNAFGVTTYRNIPIDLAPQDREMRLELRYARPLSALSSIGVSVAHAINHGHVPGRNETALLFGFNTRF